MRFPVLSPQEAASLFHNGDNVGLSGFTAPGAPKVVPTAIAEMAERLHAEGK